MVVSFRPAGQDEHVVLPGLAVDLPAEQFVQLVLPGWSLYFPETQLVQAVSLVLPSTTLYFPAAQSVQTLEPLIQYVPAGQHAEEAIEPPPLTPSNIWVLLAVLTTQVGPQRGA